MSQKKEKKLKAIMKRPVTAGNLTAKKPESTSVGIRPAGLSRQAVPVKVEGN